MVHALSSCDPVSFVNQLPAPEGSLPCAGSCLLHPIAQPNRMIPHELDPSVLGGPLGSIRCQVCEDEVDECPMATVPAPHTAGAASLPTLVSSVRPEQRVVGSCSCVSAAILVSCCPCCRTTGAGP